MPQPDPVDTIMADVPTSTSISAAAHQYQVAMSQQESVQTPHPVDPTPTTFEPAGEAVANGNTSDMIDASAHAIAHTTNAPSPAPLRTGTPVRKEIGAEISSRAASQHPDSLLTMPAEAPPHGAPTRQYLNTKITGVLLEGMKVLAKEQPKDPLKVLGEYLLHRSKELEGS